MPASAINVQNQDVSRARPLVGLADQLPCINRSGRVTLGPAPMDNPMPGGPNYGDHTVVSITAWESKQRGLAARHALNLLIGKSDLTHDVVIT